MKRKLRYRIEALILPFSYGGGGGDEPRRSTYTGFVNATLRCIILQLVNSCPHPVSGASCVPLSPSPFFLLFSAVLFLLSLRVLPSRRRCRCCRPTARCHTGPKRVGPRWWTGASSTCCAPDAFVARALPPPPYFSFFLIKSKRYEIFYVTV